MSFNRGNRKSAGEQVDGQQQAGAEAEPFFRRAAPQGGGLIAAVVGRWPWMVLGLLLGAGGAFYYLSKAPKIHSATATVLVKQRGASMLLTDKDKQEEIDMKSAEALNTVAAQLKRPGILEKVAVREEVRRLDQLVPPPVEWLPSWLKPWLGAKAESAAGGAGSLTKEALARKISGWMTVTVRRNTRLIDLKVQHPDPEVARLLADLVIEEYLSESNAQKSGGRQSSIALLKVEADRARLDLETAQKALGSYQEAMKMQAELDQKDQEISILSKRYLGEHPKMITAMAASSQLRNSFLQEIERLRKSRSDAAFWTSVEGELQLVEKVADDERLAAVKRILLSRTAVLESEIRSQESVFNAILTKLQQTDVNEAASKSTQESECESSSPAVVAEFPESPVPKLVFGVGLLFGSGFGCGLAALLAFLDNKFRSVDQVERVTGLPVLAAVGTIDLRAIRAEEQVEERNARVEQPPHEKGWNPVLVFRQSLRNSVFAEMYRVLRAAVSLLGNEQARKVTLFTSALPGEGKTITSANFAMASAAQGGSVLLIDLDLRRPSLHKVFGVPRDHEGRGSSEVLAGRCSLESAVLRIGGFARLDLLAAGEKAPNPGELLTRERISELLLECAGKYDLVVVDTAPMLAVPDTRVIAPFAHNRCLVVRAGQTPIGAVMAAAALLDQGDAPAAGIVLNCYESRKRGRRHGYGYGYGAGSYALYDYRSKGPYGVYGSDD